jgi:hypothetical protein
MRYDTVPVKAWGSSHGRANWNRGRLPTTVIEELPWVRHAYPPAALQWRRFMGEGLVNGRQRFHEGRAQGLSST